MKKILKIIIAANTLIILFAINFYLTEWIPTKKTINCLQVSIVANNPNNLFKNYDACIKQQ